MVIYTQVKGSTNTNDNDFIKYNSFCESSDSKRIIDDDQVNTTFYVNQLSAQINPSFSESNGITNNTEILNHLSYSTHEYCEENSDYNNIHSLKYSNASVTEPMLCNTDFELTNPFRNIKENHASKLFFPNNIIFAELGSEFTPNINSNSLFPLVNKIYDNEYSRNGLYNHTSSKVSSTPSILFSSMQSNEINHNYYEPPSQNINNYALRNNIINIEGCQNVPVSNIVQSSSDSTTSEFFKLASAHHNFHANIPLLPYSTASQFNSVEHHNTANHNLKNCSLNENTLININKPVNPTALYLAANTTNSLFSSDQKKSSHNLDAPVSVLRENQPLIQKTSLNINDYQNKSTPFLQTKNTYTSNICCQSPAKYIIQETNDYLKNNQISSIVNLDGLQYIGESTSTLNSERLQPNLYTNYITRELIDDSISAQNEYHLPNQDIPIPDNRVWNSITYNQKDQYIPQLNNILINESSQGKSTTGGTALFRHFHTAELQKSCNLSSNREQNDFFISSPNTQVISEQNSLEKNIIYFQSPEQIVGYQDLLSTKTEEPITKDLEAILKASSESKYTAKQFCLNQNLTDLEEHLGVTTNNRSEYKDYQINQINMNPVLTNNLSEDQNFTQKRILSNNSGDKRTNISPFNSRSTSFIMSQNFNTTEQVTPENNINPIYSNNHSTKEMDSTLFYMDNKNTLQQENLDYRGKQLSEEIGQRSNIVWSPSEISGTFVNTGNTHCNEISLTSSNCNLSKNGSNIYCQVENKEKWLNNSDSNIFFPKYSSETVFGENLNPSKTIDTTTLSYNLLNPSLGETPIYNVDVSQNSNLPNNQYVINIGNSDLPEVRNTDNLPKPSSSQYLNFPQSQYSLSNAYQSENFVSNSDHQSQGAQFKNLTSSTFSVDKSKKTDLFYLSQDTSIGNTNVINNERGYDSNHKDQNYEVADSSSCKGYINSLSMESQNDVLNINLCGQSAQVNNKNNELDSTERNGSSIFGFSTDISEIDQAFLSAKASAMNRQLSSLLKQENSYSENILKSEDIQLIIDHATNKSCRPYSSYMHNSTSNNAILDSNSAKDSKITENCQVQKQSNINSYYELEKNSYSECNTNILELLKEMEAQKLACSGNSDDENTPISLNLDTSCTNNLVNIDTSCTNNLVNIDTSNYLNNSSNGFSKDFSSIKPLVSLNSKDISELSTGTTDILPFHIFRSPSETFSSTNVENIELYSDYCQNTNLVNNDQLYMKESYTPSNQKEHNIEYDYNDYHREYKKSIDYGSTNADIHDSTTINQESLYRINIDNESLESQISCCDIKQSVNNEYCLVDRINEISNSLLDNNSVNLEKTQQLVKSLCVESKKFQETMINNSNSISQDIYIQDIDQSLDEKKDSLQNPTTDNLVHCTNTSIDTIPINLNLTERLPIIINDSCTSSQIILSEMSDESRPKTEYINNENSLCEKTTISEDKKLSVSVYNSPTCTPIKNLEFDLIPSSMDTDKSNKNIDHEGTEVHDTPVTNLKDYKVNYFIKTSTEEVKEISPNGFMSNISSIDISKSSVNTNIKQVKQHDVSKTEQVNLLGEAMLVVDTDVDISKDTSKLESISSHSPQMNCTNFDKINFKNTEDKANSIRNSEDKYSNINLIQSQTDETGQNEIPTIPQNLIPEASNSDLLKFDNKLLGVVDNYVEDMNVSMVKCQDTFTYDIGVSLIDEKKAYAGIIVDAVYFNSTVFYVVKGKHKIGENLYVVLDEDAKVPALSPNPNSY